MAAPKLHAERTAIEGRSVPAEAVRRRYERSFRNLGAVADELDALRVFDNSGAAKSSKSAKKAQRVLSARPDDLQVIPIAERRFVG